MVMDGLSIRPDVIMQPEMALEVASGPSTQLWAQLWAQE